MNESSFLFIIQYNIFDLSTYGVRLKVQLKTLTETDSQLASHTPTWLFFPSLFVYLPVILYICFKSRVYSYLLPDETISANFFFFFIYFLIINFESFFLYTYLFGLVDIYIYLSLFSVSHIEWKLILFFRFDFVDPIFEYTFFPISNFFREFISASGSFSYYPLL